MSPDQKWFDESSDAEGKPAAQPDVSADRSVPAKDSSNGRARQQPPKPPLDIKEIENLEDDAPGG
jgi:hypothetical protein